MKKEVAVILFLSILLVVPLVSAQTYSNFNRFTDNVKLFFSFGDSKVMMALEIREKEVNSALENAQALNNEGADKNLQMAWKKLQLIQERVTVKTAAEVKESSNEIIEEITIEENLTEDFEVYVLEEEKTGLTAEWVIEVNGQEGQTMQNEVVGEANGVQTRIVEIENKIDEIDNEISEWVVEHTYAEGTTAGGEAGVVVESGLATVVKNEVANGDEGLKAEVKTSVNSDNEENEADNDDEGGFAEGTTDTGDSEDTNQVDGETTDEVSEGDGGEGDYAEGTTANGDDSSESSDSAE